MSKIKNYMMDIEEKVFGLDMLTIISEADTVKIAEAQVIDQHGYKSAFDIDIAKDVVGNCWKEVWGDYV